MVFTSPQCQQNHFYDPSRSSTPLKAIKDHPVRCCLPTRLEFVPSKSIAVLVGQDRIGRPVLEQERPKFSICNGVIFVDVSKTLH
jgi:hypothetical protein